jgi:hypothetical protein
MTETTLEFIVTIKANESTLDDLKNQLDSTHSHHPLLGQVLPTMIKKTLETAGVSNEVEVNIQPYQLINHHNSIGELKAGLWLDTNGPDHYLNEKWNFLKTIPKDEIVCSD